VRERALMASAHGAGGGAELLGGSAVRRLVLLAALPLSEPIKNALPSGAGGRGDLEKMITPQAHSRARTPPGSPRRTKGAEVTTTDELPSEAAGGAEG